MFLSIKNNKLKRVHTVVELRTQITELIDGIQSELIEHCRATQKLKLSSAYRLLPSIMLYGSIQYAFKKGQQHIYPHTYCLIIRCEIS